MDSIQIRDLEVYCHHGVLKEENVLGQKFLVSLTLYMDTRLSGTCDDLSKSIDYAEVSHFVKREMEKKNFKLIESVAEHLARTILLTFPKIEKIGVEIKKPWAPILLPLDTVSVCIERKWQKVYLSVGSNMGDREKHLQDAMDALKKIPSIRVRQISDWIETEPYGYTEQDMFLNGAVELETIEPPEVLLHILQKIEQEGKRERKIHWGPRTIDLDIIFYGDVVMQTEELILPHREMHKREFVLEPLCAIAPWVPHPVYHRTVSELLEELKNRITGKQEEMP